MNLLTFLGPPRLTPEERRQIREEELARNERVYAKMLKDTEIRLAKLKAAADAKVLRKYE